MLGTLHLNALKVANIADVAFDVAVFVSGTILIKLAPVLADEVVFEVTLVRIVIFDRLAAKVLNLQVRKTHCEVDDTACD